MRQQRNDINYINSLSRYDRILNLESELHNKYIASNREDAILVRHRLNKVNNILHRIELRQNRGGFPIR